MSGNGYPKGSPRRFLPYHNGRLQIRPVEERFWERVRKSDGCWEWTGPVNRKHGYGMFFAGKGQHGKKPHRVSWEIHHGPIPSGLLVCHHCDNRKCVRPDHLFLGTHQDNATDAKRKGRIRNPVADARRAQTHCKHGHEYTSENTYWFPAKTRTGVGRSCRICRDEISRRSRSRAKARA